MSKSAKRKAHDRKRLITGRCNCENSRCRHRPGACEREAHTKHKIFDLGKVCKTCWESYPEHYRLLDLGKVYHRYRLP